MPKEKSILHELTTSIDALILARIMENDGATHLDKHKGMSMVDLALDGLDYDVRGIMKEE